MAARRARRWAMVECSLPQAMMMASVRGRKGSSMVRNSDPGRGRVDEAVMNLRSLLFSEGDREDIADQRMAWRGEEERSPSVTTWKWVRKSKSAPDGAEPQVIRRRSADVTQREVSFWEGRMEKKPERIEASWGAIEVEGGRDHGNGDETGGRMSGR